MKKVKILLPILIIISIFAYSCYNVLAVDENKASSSCDASANLATLTTQYGVNYKWEENQAGTPNSNGSYPRNKLTIYSKIASFRVLEMSYDGDVSIASLFPSDMKPSKGKDDTFYKFGNNDFVVNKNGISVIINADNQQGNTLNIKLGISEKGSSGPCDTYENQKDGFVADLEIIIPNVNAKGSSVANSNYDGLCKIIRGENYTGSTSGLSLTHYYTDSDAITYYKKLVPYCASQTVESNYSEDGLKKLINNAISTYHIVKTQRDDDALETSTSAWLIDFETVKQAAIAAGNTYTIKGSKFVNKDGVEVNFEDSAFSMNCKYQATNANLLKPTILNENGKNVYNIKANSNYYYGSKTTSESVTFTYNYNHGNETTADIKTENVEVCTRTCEEVVEVDYGPPIASRAGLCFEYEVQVTSRVKCSSDIKLEAPPVKKVCNPIPVCHNVSTSHAAGPNDDYEACINKCDGGKYSKKCSNKCFDSVYGKKSTTGFLGLFSKKTRNVEYYNYDRIVINEVSNNSYLKDFPGYDGYYYWTVYKGEELLWWNTNVSHMTYARYYEDNEDSKTRSTHGMTSNQSFQPEDGFRKKIFDNGNGRYLCKGPCRYLECTKSQYVNASDRDRDYLANVEVLDEAVKKCKGAASCSTRTAKFTINVSYDKLKDDSSTKETVKIEYPYDSNHKQSLVSLDKEDSVESSITGASNIIINRAGCYKKYTDSTDIMYKSRHAQYFSRWGFTGTWENPKTGEISYQEHAGWDKKSGKFCLPYNALNVNSSYWKYYHNLSQTKIEDLCNVDADEDCAALRDEVAAQTSVSNISKWNINAQTTNFGYFGWTFNIHCFYSTYNPSECIGENCAKVGGVDYKIRSVDLQQLFPNKTSEVSLSRTPGFNWSEYANQQFKNPNYTSIPSYYAQQVQTNGETIYTAGDGEKYLDYAFYISTDQIRQMRKRKGDYTLYSGEINKDLGDGVNHYVSDLFRGEGAILQSTKIPQIAALKCNNLNNYNSTECNEAIG